VRGDRLLTGRTERGSAPVETVFAIVFFMILVLSVIEIAFALYGRNVMAAAAHEGARAAIELGRTPSDAVQIASETVARSAGGLIEDLHVDVTTRTAGDRTVVRVHVTGTVRALGPIPVPLPVSVTATATRAVDVP
jgi:Flp pilus assembly protein TadG